MDGQTMAIFALSAGVAILLFLTVYRSRIPKVVQIISIESAINGIVVGVLQWLHLYGIDTTIAFALAIGLYSFALMATPIVFLVYGSRKSRKQMHG